MNSFELIALLVTGVGVFSFATIFTVLYYAYASSTVSNFETGKNDLDLIDDTIYANAKGKKLHRRILRRVKQVLFYLVVAIIVPLLVFALYSKFTTGIVMIGDKGTMVVASGSMSRKNEANPYLADLNDQFDTYDVIVVEKVDSDSELGLYDVIAYRNDEGINVIHRIVDISSSEGGVRYVTRGDSNNADDKYKPVLDDVIGKYTQKKVPFIGIFVIFLQSYSGILTLLAIIYCLIMIEVLGNKIFNAQYDRLEYLAKNIDFQDETEFDDNLDYKFVETITYRDKNYVLDQDGHIEKDLTLEDELSDSKLDTTVDFDESQQ